MRTDNSGTRIAQQQKLPSPVKRCVDRLEKLGCNRERLLERLDDFFGRYDVSDDSALQERFGRRDAKKKIAKALQTIREAASEIGNLQSSDALTLYAMYARFQKQPSRPEDKCAL